MNDEKIDECWKDKRWRKRGKVILYLADGRKDGAVFD
jgi:hypothetical protein